MTASNRTASEPSKAELAHRLARRCRQVVEDLLFNWEIADIDREFFDAILAELRQVEGEADAHRQTGR